MTEFVGERIQVQKDATSPRPISFKWRGRLYVVAEMLEEWVDAGFGSTPTASRVWYNRHHRRYYVVRTTSGDIFKLYYDYANRKSPTWWLVGKGEESP